MTKLHHKGLLCALTLAGAMAATSALAGDPVKVPAVPEGKGQIVFFRPSGMGPLLGFTIHEGDKDIAKVGAGSYYIYTAEPGKHTYEIKSEATDTLKMEVDAGETYYVMESISMGIMVGHPHLTMSDQAAFDKVSARLRPSKWEPKAAKADDKPATKPGS